MKLLRDILPMIPWLFCSLLVLGQKTVEQTNRLVEDITDAYVYLRNSGSRQETSIENQHSYAEKTAKSNGLRIVGKYIDKNKSAFLTDIEQRANLQKLIQDIKSGKVKCILIMSRDRMARNVQQWLTIWRILVEYNVRVIFTTRQPELNRDLKFGAFYEGRLMSSSVKESINIGTRTSAGKEKQFLAGSYTNEHIPVGYDIDKASNNVVKNEEYNFVVDIFKRFFDNQSLIEISLATKKLSGNKKWTVGYIRKILSDECYCGLRILKSKDETYKKHDPNIEPLISQSEHLQIISALEEMIKPIDPPYCFDNGVNVVCGKCKKSFRPIERYNEIYIACNCNPEPIRETILLDTLCYGILQQMSENPDYFNRILNIGLNNRLQILHEQQKVYKRRIDSVNYQIRKHFQMAESLTGQAYIFELQTIETLNNKRSALMLEEENIHQSITEEVDKHKKLLPYLKKLELSTASIYDLTNFEKKEICSELLSKVTIRAEKINIELLQ